jgi:hypothetical protein
LEPEADDAPPAQPVSSEITTIPVTGSCEWCGVYIAHDPTAFPFCSLACEDAAWQTADTEYEPCKGRRCPCCSG